MSKEQIKNEIYKVLDHLPDEALAELLEHLKQLDGQQTDSSSIDKDLEQVLKEDYNLLAKLAQ